MVWQSVLGIAVFVAAGWAISENRIRIPWRTLAAALALQFAIALLLLKVPAFKSFFLGLNAAVLALQEATRVGTSFVFGYLGGGSPPFAESHAGASFILAFQALPLILVISALSALLYHWRILPLVVGGFAWLLNRSLGVGGAAGFGVAANVFVGMVEAPLLIRPYLNNLKRADLFLIMTAGMATIAGTMMVLYATVLEPVVPNAMGHILTASLINAPAAVLVARLLVPPEDWTSDTDGGAVSLPRTTKSAVDAITRGTIDGVQLMINVAAMLIVMVALVSLFNLVLGGLPDIAGAPLTLQRLLGWIMAPVVWLLGIPWDQSVTAGGLVGIKVVLNEFLAYLELAGLPAEALEPRSRLILTYALCGFANLGSLGIMIGGLGAMAPERRGDIVDLGLKSILSGLLATLLTGAVIGTLV